MKKILIIAFIFVFNIMPSLAQTNQVADKSKNTYFEQRQKEIDEMLDSRLHLTSEQKEYIKQNRPRNIEEIRLILVQMQALHDKIKKVYNSSPSKMQADILSAPMKTELAILKQHIDKLKEENVKNFENILTNEQKIEFEKIKKENAKNTKVRN